MKEEKSTLKCLKLLPGLFRKQDVEKVTLHAAVFLSRAVKKGFIHRLMIFLDFLILPLKNACYITGT